MQPVTIVKVVAATTDFNEADMLLIFIIILVDKNGILNGLAEI